ncbi:MAG: FMN-binding protein [Elusimicrobia bacterium]|nr:FMN-binding protein [Elusimicrobiota bacterium]
MKIKIIVITILFFSIVAISKNCFSLELLNQEQALKEMFPGADKIETENHVLTSDEISSIKKSLGGELVHSSKGHSIGGSVKEKTEYDFYYCIKKGQKTGVAIIEEQPGKWGPVKYIIALDPSNGKVKNLAVMSYSEKRGRPIARHSFLDQFVGKDSNDTCIIGKDIRAISGATISSEATCFAVRKVTLLYGKVILKK